MIDGDTRAEHCLPCRRRLKASLIEDYVVLIVCRFSAYAAVAGGKASTE